MRIVLQIYDLKGSMRNRLVQPTGKENQVLYVVSDSERDKPDQRTLCRLDENLMESKSSCRSEDARPSLI